MVTPTMLTADDVKIIRAADNLAVKRDDPYGQWYLECSKYVLTTGPFYAPPATARIPLSGSVVIADAGSAVGWNDQSGAVYGDLAIGAGAVTLVKAVVKPGDSITVRLDVRHSGGHESDGPAPAIGPRLDVLTMQLDRKSAWIVVPLDYTHWSQPDTRYFRPRGLNGFKWQDSAALAQTARAALADDSSDAPADSSDDSDRLTA